MPTLRERKKRQTNEKIIAAAKHLFTANGFDKTTIDDIAADAEVGVGTLYNYYANKYELLLAVVEEIVSDSMEQADTIIATPYEDPIEQLVDFVMLIAHQWFAIDHKLMADIFIATFQNYEKFANGIMQQDVRDIEMMTRLLEAQKEQGLIRQDVDCYLAAASMHGMIAMDFMVIMFLPPGTITPELMREQIRNQMKLLYYGLQSVQS